MWRLTKSVLIWSCLKVDQHLSTYIKQQVRAVLCLVR
jgi:hypothetical protein